MMVKGLKICLSVLAILLGCLITQAQQGAKTVAAQLGAAERQRLIGLVPTPLPAGVTAQGAATFYISSTLYEYMDGAADVFQLYDVETLLHQEFRAGAVELTMDVFDMGTPENAFGIYASERSPKYDFVAIGAEGYRNEGIINFLQDRYYVKLAAFGDGADHVLDQFARSLSARIAGNRSFPALITQLPKASRKPHTEQYLRKDPLGHPFLSPAYQAVYAWDKGDATLVVSVAADPAGARDRMKSLEEHFRGSGRCDPAPEFGEGAVRASNSFEGSLIAAVQGRYLVLLLNPPGNATEFFKNAAARLK